MQLGCRPWCRCRPLVDGDFAACLKDTERGAEEEKEDTDFDVMSLWSRSHFKIGVQVFLTWPCQSDVLMRMMLSGRWLSDTRMWFSWSYTVFLGI